VLVKTMRVPSYFPNSVAAVTSRCQTTFSDMANNKSAFLTHFNTSWVGDLYVLQCLLLILIHFGPWETANEPIPDELIVWCEN